MAVKIFAATSGRSGTGYLASAFREFTSLDAYHEDPPVLRGKLLIRANSVPFPRCRTLVQKAKRIAGRSGYVDTAHQFMKGFAPYALAEMPDIKVIHLVRNPLEVMRSRLLRKSIPGKSEWVQPLGLPNQLLHLSGADLTDLQLIAWDWLEHEERFHRMRGCFREVHHVYFHELVGPDSSSVLAKLFERLRVSYLIKDEKLSDLYKNSNPAPSTPRPGDLAQFQEVCSRIRASGRSDLAWLRRGYGVWV